MLPELYSIELPKNARLSIMPRPRGGDWLRDEIAALRIAGVDGLVSLLTEAETREFELDAEEASCGEAGIAFYSLPIPDLGTPHSHQEVLGLVKRLRPNLDEGKHVAIRCRQGLGRAPLIAACVLSTIGHTADEAFELLSKARGWPVPETDEQRAWVKGFAQLGR
jgi:protein-tyrosine phosphatase